MRFTALLILAISMLSLPASAKDAYLLRFADARGRGALCHQAVWATTTLFYNLNSSSATLHLVGVSNGPVVPGQVSSVALPPGRIFTLEMPNAQALWKPNADTPLWVVHLDVPDGVVIESRNEVSDDEVCTPEHSGARGVVGKVSMPVIRELTPAGVPQVILGTDLASPDTRQNVIIFNAGDVPATATIEIRRGCDDSVVQSRTVHVPGRTVEQFGGFASGPDGICEVIPLNTLPHIRYTKITVDQPSFAVVSVLTESQEPSRGDVTPMIELAVAVNSVF